MISFVLSHLFKHNLLPPLILTQIISISSITLLIFEKIIFKTIKKNGICFLLFSSIFAGEIICKELPVSTCSFSVASSGKRCLLETYTSTNGATEFQCKTSEVYVKIIGEMIESDACVDACGVDRKSVGISSDSLMEPHFIAKLCSPACYENCPNIVDLYYNLALGEGDFLTLPSSSTHYNVNLYIIPFQFSFWIWLTYVVRI